MSGTRGKGQGKRANRETKKDWTNLQDEQVASRQSPEANCSIRVGMRGHSRAKKPAATQGHQRGPRIRTGTQITQNEGILSELAPRAGIHDDAEPHLFTKAGKQEKQEVANRTWVNLGLKRGEREWRGGQPTRALRPIEADNSLEERCRFSCHERSNSENF